MTTPAAPTPAPEPETNEAPKIETPTPEPTTETNTDLASTDLPEGTSKEADAEGVTDLGAEDDKKEEEAAPIPGAEFYGAPEGEADYEAFVAPDGLQIDETLAAEFKPIAKELNLNQKGAQKLVDLKAKDVQNQIKRWGDHLVELKTIAQKDPEIGGAEYPKAVSVAKGAITKFGTPEFRKMLNDYGVGAHPEMIRFMRKVGLAMGETPALGNGDSAGVVQKPLHEILYKD